MPNQCDVLLVSHFTNVAHKTLVEDSYYGQLPQMLADHGLSSMTACINHTTATWSELKSDWRSWSHPRIVLSRTLGGRAEATILSSLKKAKRELLDIQSVASDAQEKLVAGLAATNAVSPQSTTALRVAQQIGELVKRTKPKLMVVTYEGHPWEKLVFKAARHANPEIRCVGYHHTILFPEQHALANPMDWPLSADAVVTAGENSHHWFTDQSAYKSVPVSVLGSPRSSEASENIEPSHGMAVLVAPEGLVDETIALFEIAIETAQKMPDQKFILRLHPVVSQQGILKRRPEWAQLPKNIKWSSDTLDGDIANSRYILYRGSTVALTAAMRGVRPIYLLLPYETFSIDPLADAGGWNTDVAGAEQLMQAINNDQEQDAETRKSGCQASAQYCQKYFTQLNPQALINLLPEAGSDT